MIYNINQHLIMYNATVEDILRTLGNDIEMDMNGIRFMSDDAIMVLDFTGWGTVSGGFVSQGHLMLIVSLNGGTSQVVYSPTFEGEMDNDAAVKLKGVIHHNNMASRKTLTVTRIADYLICKRKTNNKK